MRDPAITIIIPVLNEEKILKAQERYYRDLSDKAGIIFVDGGSGDRTREVACSYGEVIRSLPGRALQKNAGARQARSEYLLFLNVDAFLSEGALEAAVEALRQGTAAGCLTMRVDDRRLLFRLFEGAVNARARIWGVVDGDLGMFIRRDIFEATGGFDCSPIMEDILFSRRLRRRARVRLLPERIHVSSRKWHERGFLKTFWDYTVAYGKLWTGKLVMCESGMVNGK